MRFTSNGIGKKNGFRFEIRYSTWLDGEETADKWYLYCSRPQGKNLYNEGTYTERSLRFPTQEAAAEFCERIASGEVTLAQLKEAEDRANGQHQAKRHRESEQKVDTFLSKLKEWGVSPALVPDIFRAFWELDEKGKEIFSERLAQFKESLVSKQMTLGEHLKVYQNDIDVCLVDKDTGEHLLPAICYLSEEDLADPDYCYEDWENWVLSLPLDHLIDVNGCPMAVVNTEFDWDQSCFLLGQNEFDSKEWSRMYTRAVWAGAEFSARLAYLSEGKSFERPFDGTCMKAEGPAQREALLKMLSESENVFIASYPEREDEYYAYSYHFDDKGKPVIDSDVDIKLTEPGKGLVSTLEGMVCWSGYVARKARAASNSFIQKAKGNGKEL